MDLESIGTGAGGGILAALCTYFGFSRRLDVADKKIDELSKAVVYKDAHEVCSCSWHMSLEDVKKKLDYIINRMDSL